MKNSNLFVALGLCVFTACSEAPKQESNAAANTVAATQNAGLPTLSDAEKAAGFKVLFNGQTPEGWKVYQTDSTNHWSIDKEGVLSTTGGHNDLITKEEFDNFELIFDWKVSKGGNSGVFYMVQDEPTTLKNTYQSGIEYQIIDDKNWNGKLEEGQKAGAIYDLYPPKVAAAKAFGEWNTGRIINDKGHLQHFINGQLIAECVWNSDDYKSRFEKSKFKDWPFAKKSKGHIALQDHGQAVAYRNIKVRVL